MSAELFRQFISIYIEILSIPAVWRWAKVVAILKPKEPADEVKSNRPILLLSMVYKLLERIILAHINDIVDANLLHAQVGFKRGLSTTDQVVHLVHNIKSAFQGKEKPGTVFVDLTVAYDTAWHRGLYFKLLKMITDAS